MLLYNAIITQESEKIKTRKLEFLQLAVLILQLAEKGALHPFRYRSQKEIRHQQRPSEILCFHSLFFPYCN